MKLQPLPLYYMRTTFDAPLWKMPFENIVEKGENGGNKYFLLFAPCFLPYERKLNVLGSI